MGQVAVLFRVMPDGVDTDLNAIAGALKAAMPPGVTIRGVQGKDIAFGLKALLVAVTMADQTGLVDTTEAALTKIPHVESVEVLEEGLL